MASNVLSVSDLDFDRIKANLRNFMKSQSQFKDYDFEGSSLSILIDLLAYNDHYLGFYANMLANEMFLDTAIFRESIVSKAKMLGYTPASRRCSIAYINVVSYIKKVESETAPSTITLDAYAKFKSFVADKEYFFITNTSHILLRNSALDTDEAWAYYKNSVKVYEGTHLTYKFDVSAAMVAGSYEPDTAHYIIPSNKIDTTTLTVTVQASLSNLDKTVFIGAGELQTVTSSDNVYWLHEVGDNRYEIKFGDGENVGSAVEFGNIITVDYIATNGVDANGCKVFIPSSKTYSGWTIPVSESGFTATAVQYRVLELVQLYPSNFIVGEVIRGTISGAIGTVEEWNNVTTILSLIRTQNTFQINETVVGLSSGAIGTIKMSSLEISSSSNGTERESSSSIKNLSLKTYQAQNRCVTTNDYEVVIKRDYPNIRAIKVWGGEENNPPVYGKVFISLRPHVGQILTNTVKEKIRTDILSKRKVVTVQVEFVDPDYLYIIPTCVVKYNPTKTDKSPAELISLVTAKIREYEIEYLNDFTSPFYYTKLTSIIDSVDSSIASNILSIQIKKYFDLPFNTDVTNYVVDFNNAFKTPSVGSIVGNSSKFTFNGIENCSFAMSVTDFNVLQVIDINNQVVLGGEDVGVIDFDAGTVTITKFKCSATEKTNTEYPEFKGRIEMIAYPRENDIFSFGQQIPDILASDITVSTIDVRNLL